MLKIIINSGKKGNSANCKLEGRMLYRASTSFPSGHAAMGGAGLGFLILEYGLNHNISTAVCLALMQIFIAVSRVANKFHRISDVCVGFVIGWFIGFMCFYWMNSRDVTQPLADQESRGIAESVTSEMPPLRSVQVKSDSGRTLSGNLVSEAPPQDVVLVAEAE